MGASQSKGREIHPFPAVGEISTSKPPSISDNYYTLPRPLVHASKIPKISEGISGRRSRKKRRSSPKKRTPLPPLTANDLRGRLSMMVDDYKAGIDNLAEMTEFLDRFGEVMGSKAPSMDTLLGQLMNVLDSPVAETRRAEGDAECSHCKKKISLGTPITYLQGKWYHPQCYEKGVTGVTGVTGS